MAIKDILVHLDNSPQCAARQDVAIGLARDFDAHLTGLYVMPSLMIGVFAEVQIPEEIIVQQQEEARAAAAAVESEFKNAAARAACPAEWRCVEGDAIDQINGHARYTDLVVLGQAEQSGILSPGAELADQVVLGAARPVLFIPYIGPGKTLGKRILVAWNGSREAVRAINDALPLLQHAEAVHVLAINPSSAEGDIPTADISLHLARHSVKAEASQVMAKDIEVGDALLSRAADLGIDLIVMGAYGHTRLRETILGGVTRRLLRHMTTSVLMSH
ncbi:MAG: universal stress protein [Gammaproteobacteria bacterium]